MATAVATVPAGATVRDAARLMLERRVSALPVVDKVGRMIGIVSEGDLMRRTELGTESPRSWWLKLFAGRAAREYLKAHGATVRDVMTRPVISVRRTTPLDEVARLLESHRIKRVPVLQGERLVGIVSRADLVRRLATAPARPTARTQKDRGLRRQVLKALERAGADLRYLNATVEHGVVHLWGSVTSHGQQKTLRVAAKALDGVRAVDDHTSVMPLEVAAELRLL